MQPEWRSTPWSVWHAPRFLFPCISSVFGNIGCSGLHSTRYRSPPIICEGRRKPRLLPLRSSKKAGNSSLVSSNEPVLIKIPVDVSRRLAEALQNAGTREIGGILMGEHVSDNAFVVRD